MPASVPNQRTACTQDDIADLERAAPGAVAPLKVQKLQGRQIPLDRSTIGRAKSAIPLRHLGPDTAQLHDVEACHHAWRRPYKRPFLARFLLS